MNDAISQFRDAMRAAGLEPPDMIEQGKWHRFPGIGKKPGTKDGFCTLFDDGLGGYYGDWSSGLKESWQAKRDTPLSTSELAAFKRHIAEARAKAEAERKVQQAEAARKAATIWSAATPAPDDHPYLVAKGIRAHGVRLHHDALLIPVRTGNEVHTLQFIYPGGKKRFLSGGRVTGGYFGIGTTEGAAALCICEGFATGATIHEATGYPVVVAFNAGNLKAVAQALRGRFPTLPLILCADDDAATEGNPGMTKATEAALAVGGQLAIPDFGTERTEGITDFNDMAKLCGMEAVGDSIKNATVPSYDESDSSTQNEQWPEPQSLVVKVDPVPYPLDALPDSIRAAVEEVQGFTKAPMPLVTSSALAALSLAIQAHTDVKRAEMLTGPVSLFLLTIADSGERKSTCDGYFTKSVRDYEAAQAEAAKSTLKEYTAASEAWEAKRSGIKDKIRQLAKADKATEGMKKSLCELEHEKPEPPRIPRLLYADATPEALAHSLAKNWPSGGVMSAEAGIVFGAHGMGKESVMRNLSQLNVLWDGGTQTIDRRSKESFVVRGARLTVALQVQEATLREFFERSGNLARGTGFLARFLVAWPESTQGSRPFTEPPEHWPALEAFNRLITAILEQPTPIDKDGALTPLMLSLSEDAKKLWMVLHDNIENELCSGGELYDVRDVASKTADNAVRLAALFQYFKDGGCVISAEVLESAGRIAAWHLHEARRFLGEFALPAELADAARLDSWLINYCLRQKTHIIPRREVQRNVSPTHLRQKAALNAALSELVEAGRILLVQEGRRKEIHLNPALLKGN